MVDDKINIPYLFAGFQEQMKTKLTTNRHFIAHPGTKGDTSEFAWIEWLAAYLPKRYSVDKAIIIDSENCISEQIDIVIYDNLYSPFVFNQDGAIYIPSESVYAVFEVKQELDKTNIEYAMNKVSSVRRLKRTSATITHAGGKFEPKNPSPIIGGLITLSSKYDICQSKSFGDNILVDDAMKQLDIGIVLEQGTYSKSGTDLKVSKKDGLLYFFLQLLSALQSIGTVTAMDIGEYMKHITME